MPQTKTKPVAKPRAKSVTRQRNIVKKLQGGGHNTRTDR